MKPNQFWFFKLVVWLIIVLIGLLLFVYPFVTGLLINLGRMPLGAAKYLAIVETSQVILMRFLALVWIFFLGSCFASFLNVVAWRVPRGRGINGSSHCPYCNNRLSFRDNIPIVGWLRNQGRCRDCRLPISPRYLIVEVILGFVFLLLNLVQLLSGGLNLPLRAVETLRGFEHLVFDPKWDLIQLTIYHLVLICYLFTFALIRSEKLKIPVSLLGAGLMFGIGLPLVWPSMLLVSWQINSDELIPLTRFSPNQLLTMALGSVVGLGCGSLVHWSRFQSRDALEAGQRSVRQSSYVYEAIAGFLLIGLFLGWQSALSVGLFYYAISIPIAMSGINNWIASNLSSRLMIATLLHLIGWRFLTWLYVWPGPTSHWGWIVVAVLVLVGLAILTRRMTGFKSSIAGPYNTDPNCTDPNGTDPNGTGDANGTEQGFDDPVERKTIPGIVEPLRQDPEQAGH